GAVTVESERNQRLRPPWTQSTSIIAPEFFDDLIPRHGIRDVAGDVIDGFHEHLSAEVDRESGAAPNTSRIGFDAYQAFQARDRRIEDVHIGVGAEIAQHQSCRDRVSQAELRLDGGAWRAIAAVLDGLRVDIELDSGDFLKREVCMPPKPQGGFDT